MMPNKVAALNPAIVLRFHVGRHRRGIGEPGLGGGSAILGGVQSDMKCKREMGFTLTELLVAIAVIAILAVLLLPVLSGA